ncbi:hypothetical protein VTL71DRAFT_8890 [Oculimacula yallundae]|uniref:Uncharacterized protein n=1 Tax=Oculimacula yallundae TaxID=86028 RepID=A0ABR4BT64_9HELO
MDNQGKDKAPASSSSSPSGDPPVNWLGIPAQPEVRYRLQVIVDAMATQYPDRPQPTLAELTAIARQLGFVNHDGSVNHNAPIPGGSTSIPSVVYDNTAIAANEQIIETPRGEDAGLHAIINSLKAQIPQHNPPTLAELKEIMRELKLGFPLREFDLAAILQRWGEGKGLKLNLGVKTGKKE